MGHRLGAPSLKLLAPLPEIFVHNDRKICITIEIYIKTGLATEKNPMKKEKVILERLPTRLMS